MKRKETRMRKYINEYIEFGKQEREIIEGKITLYSLNKKKRMKYLILQYQKLLDLRKWNFRKKNNDLHEKLVNSLSLQDMKSYLKGLIKSRNLFEKNIKKLKIRIKELLGEELEFDGKSVL
ncbi:hypothetical protein LCGC14_1161020 [marine sediment metagenome]|uniref:Uncharacterized protein n=1 Tax=marine sediment metagenome TaxID=412755 RepID=A0A0F9LXM6_9ZZZZ